MFTVFFQLYNALMLTETTCLKYNFVKTISTGPMAVDVHEKLFLPHAMLQSVCDYSPDSRQFSPASHDSPSPAYPVAGSRCYTSAGNHHARKSC